MSDTQPTPIQQLVECDVCMKEIPLSSAKNEETSDYVFHFCGIDCYAKWKQQADLHNKNQTRS